MKTLLFLFSLSTHIHHTFIRSWYHLHLSFIMFHLHRVKSQVVMGGNKSWHLFYFLWHLATESKNWIFKISRGTDKNFWCLFNPVPVMTQRLDVPLRQRKTYTTPGLLMKDVGREALLWRRMQNTFNAAEPGRKSGGDLSRSLLENAFISLSASRYVWNVFLEQWSPNQIVGGKYLH